MKRLITSVLVSLTIIAAASGTALAHRNDGLEGLIFGAGSGAIVGQLVGGDVETAILGSFIGGTLGLMVDLDRSRVVVREYRKPRVRAHYGRDHRHREKRWGHKRGHQHDRKRHWSKNPYGRW